LSVGLNLLSLKFYSDSNQYPVKEKGIKGIMVFNATFNNISVISWRQVKEKKNIDLKYYM